MPDREFSLFSATLNPFRTLDRQIDRLLDDGFGAGVAGAASGVSGVPAPADLEDPRAPSLFLRVVGITVRPKAGG